MVEGGGETYLNLGDQQVVTWSTTTNPSVRAIAVASGGDCIFSI
jgi:hypothetical protein